MSMALSPLTAAATLAALVLAPTIALLLDAWWGSVRRAVVLRAAILALASALTWLAVIALTTPELDPLLILPTAGLASVAAILAAAPLTRVVDRSAPVLLFGVSFTAAVFSPVAIAVLSDKDGLLGAGLGTLDLGGALPVLVASGAAGMAVLLGCGRLADPPATPARSAVVPLFALVWGLWIVWLVGMELVIDAITPQIAVNAVVAPLASAAAWLVVQRIRQARTSVVATVGGLFNGLVAVTAGCGFLDGIGAAIVGLISGTASSLIGYAAVRRSGRPAWLLVTVLVVSGSFGTLLLGVFALRSGLMFTGQPEVIIAQAASAFTVIVYSFGVSALLWLVIRRVLVRPRVSVRS